MTVSPTPSRRRAMTALGALALAPMDGRAQGFPAAFAGLAYSQFNA